MIIKCIGYYANGNYNVSLFEDGTKIRCNELDNLTPSFAESIDVCITKRCNGGCPMCYEGCDMNQEHPDIMSLECFDHMHPYTEVAINGNDLTHPQLIPFLKKLKSQNVIANITVNYKHYRSGYATLRNLQKHGLIHGIGVSLTEKPSINFVRDIVRLDNVVIHAIAGIVQLDWLKELQDRHLKILILGYKEKGRGIQYKRDHLIQKHIDILSNALPELVSHFDVISFDNLAIEQLNVRNLFSSSEDYSRFYMGDDGMYTFYIDCSNRTFAKDSMSSSKYTMEELSVDDMFYIIQREVRCA